MVATFLPTDINIFNIKKIYPKILAQLKTDSLSSNVYLQPLFAQFKNISVLIS